MDERAFWGEPMGQVGMFSGADSQGGLLYHTESPYWGSETWAATPSRPDEIHDIGSMSPALPFDQGVLEMPVPGVHDLGAPYSQHEPWIPTVDVLYPTQDVQEMLNNPFLYPSTLGMLPQEYNMNHKSFGTITSMQQPSRQVASTTTAPSSQFGGGSRAVNSSNAMSQYGSSPVVQQQNTMPMFAPPIPRGGIVAAPSLGGGGMNTSNPGLMIMPRRHNTPSLAPKTGGDVTLPGASTPKGSASVLMPLPDSSHMHKMDEEPKRSSFNPGPYVNSSVVPTSKPPPPPPPQQQQQHDQQQQQDLTSMWGKSSSVPIPNMGLRKQPPMCSSSPVTSSGYPPSMSNSPVSSIGFDQRHSLSMSGSPLTNYGIDQRHQQSLNNSSPVTNIGLEQRRQQAMSNSSPVTHFGIEQRPKPPPMSSSPIPIVGFQPKQQHQPLPSSSPIPSMGFEQQSMSISSSRQQQPAVSTSPPLSNLSFEPRQPHQQQPVSSPPPVSAPVYEPRRQQTNLTSNPPPSVPNLSRQQQPPSVPILSRQQPSTSNPRSTVPVSGDSVPKWPAALRMAGGLGGSTGLPGSDKAPMMTETGTLKCALPRNSIANASPAANPANKRPLYPDDNKNQGGSMTKKPLNKWQGQGGCSRLEEISNAAHQKVTQTTSGRALGPALNTNLKPRARQGSANDPQSIAARVRRERISERLKVLQTLIPNGDKVDMVTMLEKAINYVRCLELQIRMLKNDSLWPKALGPLPNTLQELLELAGPDFQDEREDQEETPEKTKTTPEVIEMDGNQPSADRE